MRQRISRSFVCTLAFCLLAAPALAQKELFPRPAAAEPDVQFWIRIYTGVDTGGGLLHDARDLGVVYRQIDVPRNISRRARERHVGKYRKRIEATLRKLGAGRRSGLSAEEQRILALFPPDVSNATLKAASQRVRFQLGQANKFRAGLVRSGAWIGHIRSTLREMGLPTELAAIPHVESSYTPTVYSHVGAAGLWQFTRGTGRRFMRVDHVVDERLDPYRATIGAARLLAQNYQTTGTWPLAITSYNHGAAGMRRAKRKLGTTDIATISRKYRSRTFGFASRNFYFEFLAALEVDFNADQYFGPLRLDRPTEYETVSLPFFAPVASLERAFGVERSVLRAANPALRPLVWSGEKRVPKGFVIKLPRHHVAKPLDVAVTAVPDAHQFARQTRDETYRVRRGDTLSTIARRYRTTISELASLNNLRSKHRIRIGQKLRLPADKSRRRGSSPERAPVLDAAPSADGVYVVQRGDTTGQIAKRFGVSAGQIARWNNLRSASRIYPGQSLVVQANPTATPAAIVVAKAESKAAPAVTTLVPAQPPAAAMAQIEIAVPAEVPVRLPAKALVDAEAQPAAEPVKLAAISPPPDTVEVEQPTPPTSPPPSATAPEPEPAAAPAAETLALEPPPATLRPVAELEIASDESTTTDATALSLDESESVDGDAPALSAEEAIATEDPRELLTALVADPSDYSVAEDGTIEVQAAETLGHIAEWLDVRASALRKLNGMRYGEPIQASARLRLDFGRVSKATFQQRRLAHHRSIQEDFFERFEIAGTGEHTIRRGESIWLLSRRSRVPVWLLRQYNPDVDFGALHAGMTITLPKVRSHAENGTG